MHDTTTSYLTMSWNITQSQKYDFFQHIHLKAEVASSTVTRHPSQNAVQYCLNMPHKKTLGKYKMVQTMLHLHRIAHLINVTF